jgi:D-arabinitol 4-dehydrogenase
MDDAAPVTAEAFIQWIIENKFINDRPCLENVGVELVSDVIPYEEAKIRILNASHSCIAWAGTLAGKNTFMKVLLKRPIFSW